MNYRERIALRTALSFAAAFHCLACSDAICPAGTKEIDGRCLPSMDNSSNATIGVAASSGSPDIGAGGQTATANAGLGGAGASAAPNTSARGQGGQAAASGAEACSVAGAVRCSALVQGKREQCMNGAWTSAEACPLGQTCVTDATGQPSCVAVAELCRGNAGQAICDMRGSLIVCNADATIKSQDGCRSPRHCQTGLAMQTCATCIPNAEYRCTGKTLEVCSPDSASFTRQEDCDTEALCNELVGLCTTAVCAPGKTACDGNSLVTCNADGSAIATPKPCGAGFCDMTGGDCNQCEPGTKKCEQDMVMTCDPTGQAFTASPCPSGNKCVGMGQCVACDIDDDCSALTQGCKVGVCDTTNRCVAQNAPNGQQCTTTAGRPGTCSSGQCQCTPQCTNKQCGPNGCDGMCPNLCDNGQMCLVDRCVDCQRDSDCSSRNSVDGCRVGICSGNTCATTNAPNGTLCTGEPGMCSGGTCECEGSCTPGTCGVDNGCGQQCTCSGGQQCRSNRCVTVVPIFTPCNTESPFSSECGNDREAGYACFRANPGVRSICAPNVQNGVCPSGLVPFSGGSPCVAGCPFGNDGSACPPEVPACQANPAGTEPVGVCVLP